MPVLWHERVRLLRARIAAIAAMPSSCLPNVPTVIEAGVPGLADFAALAQHGFYGPRTRHNRWWR